MSQYRSIQKPKLTQAEALPVAVSVRQKCVNIHTKEEMNTFLHLLHNTSSYSEQNTVVLSYSQSQNPSDLLLLRWWRAPGSSAAGSGGPRSGCKNIWVKTWSEPSRPEGPALRLQPLKPLQHEAKPVTVKTLELVSTNRWKLHIVMATAVLTWEL